MNAFETICVILGVLTLLGGGVGFFMSINSHLKLQDAKHESLELRVTTLENTAATTQKDVCEIKTGVAVLLERTKHMGN